MAFYGPHTWTPGCPAEAIVSTLCENETSPRRIPRGQLARLLLMDPEGFVDRFGDEFRIFVNEKRDVIRQVWVVRNYICTINLIVY